MMKNITMAVFAALLFTQTGYGMKRELVERQSEPRGSLIDMYIPRARLIKKVLFVGAMTCLFAGSTMCQTTNSCNNLGTHSAMEKCGRLVMLPEASVLGECFRSEGFNHFLEKTKIDKKLSKEMVCSKEVPLIVDNFLREYSHNVDRTTFAATRMLKQNLVEILLGESCKE